MLAIIHESWLLYAGEEETKSSIAYESDLRHWGSDIINVLFIAMLKHVMTVHISLLTGLEPMLLG
jgi:hypothetical protein